MDKIKNFNELAVSPLRKAALRIVEVGLAAIDTSRVVESFVRYVRNTDTLTVGKQIIPLTGVGRVVVVGIGKCALEGARSLERVLGNRLWGGVVLHIGGVGRLKTIQTFKGTHPFPSEKNMQGAARIVDVLKGLQKNDLVLFLISGGGSTLLCLPQDRQCIEEIVVVRALMRAGASIKEVNTVRKHLSLARGGYLAQYAYPARAISLIFSDVPGDDLQFIASGPTVRDTTTVFQAEKILAKYSVLKTCGIEHCGLVETPKASKYFSNVRNIIMVSSDTALHAMKAKAKELGFTSVLRARRLAGEAREMGLKIAKELHGASPKTAFLYGGETTVRVVGHGRGGRNLELALAALHEMREGELIVTVASDGRDNGEFGGAICDTITGEAARALKVDFTPYLRENDEYPFFEKVGHYIMTGDTGSNVSDLVISMKE
ncbi:MAG: hypothetical protein A2945_04595 [Candidatus Liptonbacteria bacterium RIFCSPLOWO2_01_FULL_52_25]|uniref:Glycerate kinase n=1 Tax=Candidatus Liptonbacteria bacterium RIFCSPLOWO2_01_FULL_52_25 TaxID=1798650 RepID=A0A1G2CGC1_9BACT|nr:MAG: hypothetical protein A2945_04595 [Candidatus Liptonbacteria bacterium RIFCSPLOWO2_01_FULL_52_25]